MTTQTISRRSAIELARYLIEAGHADLVIDALHALPEAGVRCLTNHSTLRAAHAAWSQIRFGNVSAVGPAKHLAKEALEVASAPLDVAEHADCWMLLWDMQRRAGISDTELASAIEAKLITNMARYWPAPTEGEACEHVRDSEGGANG
ncbi:dATP/dGTP pyrophosphohydrolase domain-containing protein [Roseinatronobacter sp.]|uniref:dATP/dGTP pyrophosphohydrolase domain-containing protein n=1 Tax=Roseinatronobacter sp. TaxID=1945755 RepID=UPI003F71EDB7